MVIKFNVILLAYFGSHNVLMKTQVVAFLVDQHQIS